MKNSKKNFEILLPKNQLQLFGYDNYFNFFIKLFKTNKLPNTILFSGQKGSGKATFAYHLSNYLLSDTENYKYDTVAHTIHSENKSYINLCNSTHPNFFLLENSNIDEDIKIENIKDVLKFIKKTAYNSGIKIVLVDNAEYLNISSSNALLKALEEPYNNTIFFIIHDSCKKILNTIKSRSFEFKFFVSQNNKKKILQKIIKQYENNLTLENLDDDFYLDTHGNIIRYLKILKDNDINSSNDKLFCISSLIDKYKNKKDPQFIFFISLLVELFYKELSMQNEKNINIYFYNKFKILKQINEAKRFNLDKNNLFISLQNILKNEAR